MRIKNLSGNPDPVPAHPWDAGADLRAYLPDGPVTLAPGQYKVIPTGLWLETLEPGLELQVRPRSGLAAKHGITVLNSPGTIDAGYTGEIRVILINHGSCVFTVNNGDRIAQLVPGYVANVDWGIPVTLVPERGSSGFGSTGTD